MDKKKKKKKSVVKLFFISLLKSLLCIALILGVGFASYKISYTVLTQGESGTDRDSDDLQDIVADATTDEISKNLIYVSDDKNKVTNVILEICNTKTYNMDYITIPVKTNYTIPSVMYRKLCQINPEIPQVIRVSDMKQYFENESDAYGYGVLIFEKMLGIDISYYTALSKETYSNHYTQQKVKVAFRTESTLNNTPGPDGTTPSSNTVLQTKMKISVISEAYRRQLEDLEHDQTKMANFIKAQYDRVTSNLTVYNKIGYLEAYQNIDVSMIHFWGIPGVFTDKVFEVDAKAAKRALKQLINNTETYTTAQDLTQLNMIGTSGENASSVAEGGNNTTVDSRGMRIYVLNGSQIGGLASATQSKLQAAGYTVPEVGNYTAETLTTTRIIVKEKGQGEDLKQYFNNPELIVGNVTAGYDIEIILGTVDAN